MILPPQAPPVRRPTLVEPHRLVEVDRGDPRQLLRVRLYLLHGANFNDPAPWEVPPMARMRTSGLSAGGFGVPSGAFAPWA